MAEGTAQSGSESMEDILQSIKRIMDDGTEGDAKPAAQEDVFDLTNALKEESAAAAPSPKVSPQPSAREEMPFQSMNTGASEPAIAVPPVRIQPSPEEGLMSEEAATEAATALRKIADTARKDYSIPSIPSPQLRNGNTVEDLVLEALRPMLKEWLDENLPVLVQKIVEKEVKRIVNLHFDLE